MTGVEGVVAIGVLLSDFLSVLSAGWLEVSLTAICMSAATSFVCCFLKNFIVLFFFLGCKVTKIIHISYIPISQ